VNDREFDYDAFLSHAGEDSAWCERLADRLRNETVRVWFRQLIEALDLPRREFAREGEFGFRQHEIDSRLRDSKRLRPDPRDGGRRCRAGSEGKREVRSRAIKLDGLTGLFLEWRGQEANFLG
jgi:hypothetical protein